MSEELPKKLNNQTEAEINQLTNYKVDGYEGAHPTSYAEDFVEAVTGIAIERIPWEWYEPNENIKTIEATTEYFKSILKGKKVLDLGFGVQGAGYVLADFCESSEYVGGR